MIFRRRKSIEKEKNQTSLVNYVFLPVYRGKIKSNFSKQVLKIIQDSKFCSKSPFIKRLIVNNVEMFLIVIETSGAQSIKIICTTVPTMVNLLSRVSPRFKAFLENEQVLFYFNFFKEIDYEGLLSSLCSATVVIQKGITKYYPIVCTYLGRETLFLSKSCFDYLYKSLSEFLLYVLRYICEDLPDLLQRLCAQNYKFAKYTVQNLPFIALGTTKYAVIFVLFIQQPIKKVIKFARETLLNFSSDYNVFELYKRINYIFKQVFIYVTSRKVIKQLNYYLIYISKWYILCLRENIPLFYQKLISFIPKVLPYLRQLLRDLLILVPKFLTFLVENEDLIVNYLKHFIKQIKPLTVRVFKLCEIIVKHIVELSHSSLINLKYFLPRVYNSIKHFLKNNPDILQTIGDIYVKFKNLYCILCKLSGGTYYLLINSFEFIFASLKQVLRIFIFHATNIINYWFNFIWKYLPVLKPALQEVNLTLCYCSGEVTSKFVLSTQRVVPSMWCGLKTVAPTTLKASYEIVLTTRKSIIIMYPTLLKSIVVVYPEVGKGLIVILQDGNKAYLELAKTSYIASREMIQIAKCLSRQLPLVFNAYSEVSTTTSGAISEVFTSTLKAKNRVTTDLLSAARRINTALNSAEKELIATVDTVSSDFYSSVEMYKVWTLTANIFNWIIMSVLSKQRLEIIHGILIKIIEHNINVIITSYNQLNNKMNLIFRNILQMISITKILVALIEFKSSTSDSSESIKKKIALLLAEMYSKILNLCHEMLQDLMTQACITVPKLWKTFKQINYTAWSRLCELSPGVWTCIEDVANRSWKLTCFYAPVLWSLFKTRCTFAWQLTCDLSPTLWGKALPVFPILYVSNRDFIQRTWLLHIKTYNTAWKIVVPLTSTSWEYTQTAIPFAWIGLCENSKTRWNKLCTVVEYSWNKVTQTGSISWKVFESTVATSWKLCLKPLTTSGCYLAGNTIIKSAKISSGVWEKAGKIIQFF